LATCRADSGQPLPPFREQGRQQEKTVFLIFFVFFRRATFPILHRARLADTGAVVPNPEKSTSG